MHHGMPIIKGYKAIITKWFRSNSCLDNGVTMFSKQQNEYLPNFTEDGFAKSILPAPLFKNITDFYQQNKASKVDEHVAGDFIVHAENKNDKKSSQLIELSDALRQEIHDTMKPILEAWCQQDLDPTHVYGIREYSDKAVLKPHRDRRETHIISVILNVAQTVNEDWPLVIEDNFYRKHHVMLKPGEMIFYEGARLLHGRPIPLNGESYANIFCHFTPRLQ
jgi:prolyl 4-hydroxylase